MRYNHLPCVVILFVLFVLGLAVGGYFTYMHPKQIHLVSCYLEGGSCLEVWNCEEKFLSRHRTTCINKRKVCCMPSIQVKNQADELVYIE
ncbi:uncharacterized protein LOC108101039 [Drosophila ficusphila]|uniref:uncharacterized protein LOC108101039 n=1 Tax=Drosophila ficusphila TaxID=30025 RepID=UPI0007E6CE47|nr:uncharacterized protein LOC108101039 [Drosophila ficusphila]XP_017060699.1 uncharacterized protein LOC108101039 [Drosophila ficusphila]